MYEICEMISGYGIQIDLVFSNNKNWMSKIVCFCDTVIIVNSGSGGDGTWQSWQISLHLNFVVCQLSTWDVILHSDQQDTSKHIMVFFSYFFHSVPPELLFGRLISMWWPTRHLKTQKLLKYIKIVLKKSSISTQPHQISPHLNFVIWKLEAISSG